MRILLYLLTVFMMTGCLSEEPKITVIGIESWTDLMPGTPGKTYLQLRFNITDTENDSLSVAGVKVGWKNGSYSLQKEEFDYHYSGSDANSAELSLRGVFLAGQKDIDTLNAEIIFFYKGGSMTKNIQNIKVEKVY